MFSQKFSYFSYENICFGYSLEAACKGILLSTHDMFSSRNKKKCVPGYYYQELCTCSLHIPVWSLHVKTCLWAYVNREDPDQTARMQTESLDTVECCNG